MNGVSIVVVEPTEADQRLDRWFRHRFPNLAHGRLEKLLRTGQVRVDGRRAKAGLRLAAGQSIRIPPLDLPSTTAPRPSRISEADADRLRRAVLHMDEWVIAIDKPTGLAVQGGTKTEHHLDAMLDALRFEASERPRLVHRLDRDTSGVLLLARGAAAARSLAGAFRDKSARKLYWAVTVGVPKRRAGRIDLPLAKVAGPAGERVAAGAEEGQRAVTQYRVVDIAGRKAAWLALMPVTGRTHQLRVHCVALGTPILGDGKYGGLNARLPGLDTPDRLHLHARAIRIPHPRGGWLELTAPLPPHMSKTFRFLGFTPDHAGSFDVFDE